METEPQTMGGIPPDNEDGNRVPADTDRPFGPTAQDMEHSSGYISLDDVLGIDDTGTTDVVVPEWGGRVLKVRRLELGDVRQIQRRSVRMNERAQRVFDPFDAIVWAVIIGSVEPHFTEKHFDVLAKKHPGALARVAKEISDFSGLTGGFAEEAMAQFQGIADA